MAGKNLGKAPRTREDRLKAALKANMAKRKAQALARKAGDGAQDKTEAGKDGQDG